MNLSAPFVARPVATTLLAIGVVLAGAVAFTQLPVSPLPQVDYPTISVTAQLPGASPETMASTVATPLERSLGRIAGVTEITSSSSLGSSRTMTLPEIQNLADTRLAQKLSQVAGVGLVTLSGGQRPAVRVQANPLALAANSLGLEDVGVRLAVDDDQHCRAAVRFAGIAQVLHRIDHVGDVG